MKKLLTFMFIGLFLISFASAATFDNRLRSYNAQTETVIIDDNFGLGGDLVKIQLVSNTYTCLTDCEAVWNVTIYKDDDNFLTDLIFELGDINSHEFQVLTGYSSVTVNDYGEDCSRKDSLGICAMIITGTHREDVPTWTTFNPERKLSAGNYIIKLKGTKDREQTVDWIPTFYGKEIREWAFWASTAPTTVWEMNQLPGATITNDTLGLNNLTANQSAGDFQAGLLNNSWRSDVTTAGIMLNTSGASQFAFDENNFTLAFWINSTVTAGAFIQLETSEGGSGWGINTDGGFTNMTFVSSGAVRARTQNTLNDGLWHRVVFVREGTGSNQFKVYEDGNNTANFTNADNMSDATTALRFNAPNNNGNLSWDSFQIYKEFAWTAADALFDYNNGTGIEAGSLPEPSFPLYNVTLNSPANNLITSLVNITFNATGFPVRVNSTNASLLLYNASTGDILQQPSVLINQSVSNESIFTLNNLDLAQFNWSVLYCGINNSGATFCDTSLTNFTFTIGVQEINSFFVNQTIEGSTNTFQINVSIPDGRQIATNNLIYNNTINAGTRTVIAGNNFTISTTQAAPIVDSQTNISFFWNITLDNGVTFSSTLSNQSVIALNADDCTTNGVLILNYTLKDEDDQITTVPDGNLINSTMQIDLTINSVGTNDSIITFSQNYTNTNPAQVCLNQINDSSYDMDVLIRYEFTDHVVEFNNLQKFRLQNSSIPQNINLLDLATVNSQEFLVTFKDKNTLPIQGALIDVSRKYISEGVFKSVEVPLTDVNAQVIAHLVLSDEIYTFTVTKDGVILGVFENLVAFCDNIATGDCTINLNAFSPGFNSENFITTGNLNLQTTYDRDSMIITTLFSTIDGSVATVQLNGTLNDALGNTTICSDLLTSSSGTLTCTVPNSFGNSSVISQIFNGGSLVGQNVFSTELDPADLFGGTRVVLVMILFSTVSLMALSSGPATLVLSSMSLIIGGLLNLYIEGSIIGQGSILLWFGVAIAVILFKISRRNAD